jgi:hypothetical protein
MLPAIFSFLLAIVGGVVGWLLVSFLGTPFLEFRNLRKRVHEEVIFTGNIDPMVAGKPEHAKAVESLRRLGAQVQATDVAAVRPLRWFLSVRGYDLTRASRSLIGLSNSLAETHDIRLPRTNSVLTGLRLPPLA